MDIEPILQEVHREYLVRMTHGDGQLLRQVEHYAAARQGKMLRPRLTLLAAATLGEEVLHSRRTLLLATCVEMLHNASLLHDDVIDHELQRRGQPSVNARWNSSIAVLVGDYHLAQIMALLDEIDDADAPRIINRTVMSMVEAELLQQEILSGLEMTEERYLKIIDGKTASLFSAACALGNPACAEFGLHYGRLFQLRDDMADGEDTPWTNSLVAKEEQTIASLPMRLELPMQ